MPLPVEPDVTALDLVRAVDAAVLDGDLHRARRLLAALAEGLEQAAQGEDELDADRERGRGRS